MIIGLSLYGLLTAILLNLKDRNIFISIIKNATFWVSVLIPVIVLNPTGISLYIPIAVTVIYSFLFKKEKNTLLLFLMIYASVLATVNNSFLWFVGISLLLNYVIFILNNSKLVLKEKMRFELIQIVNIIFLLLSVVFWIIAQSITTGSNNELVATITSIFFLLLYIYKCIGVLGPNRFETKPEQANLDNSILIDVISMYFIPIMFIPSIEQITYLLTTTDVNYLIIILMTLFGVITYTNLIIEQNKFNIFLRLAYASTYTCSFLVYLFGPERSYLQLVLVNTVSFFIFVLASLIDKRSQRYKKYFQIILLLLILPCFVNPVFYKLLQGFNLLLEQVGHVVGLFFIFSLLYPYLFINIPIQRILFSSDSDKINKYEIKATIFWSAIISITYLALYYEQI